MSMYNDKWKMITIALLIFYDGILNGSISLMFLCVYTNILYKWMKVNKHFTHQNILINKSEHIPTSRPQAQKNYKNKQILFVNLIDLLITSTWVAFMQARDFNNQDTRIYYTLQVDTSHNQNQYQSQNCVIK